MGELQVKSTQPRAQFNFRASKTLLDEIRTEADLCDMSTGAWLRWAATLAMAMGRDERAKDAEQG